jgi:hypothetical protein
MNIQDTYRILFSHEFSFFNVFIFRNLDPNQMGRVDKGVNCGVSGCSNSAERSISGSKASMASDLEVNTSNKRVYLCRQHYKEWKKATKEDRENERARWG